MDCKTCEDVEVCRYTSLAETCMDCKFNEMYFDYPNDDPCNTCVGGSNFEPDSDYFE